MAARHGVHRSAGDAVQSANGATKGLVYWLHSDHLGSASLTTYVGFPYMIKTAGEMRYLPFGETRWASGELQTDRRFTGQRWEAGLGGLYDYGDGTRFYSPALGRFISADTIVPQPVNPQTLNRYSYTRSNPLKYTDPTGHDVGCPGRDASECSSESSSMNKLYQIDYQNPLSIHLERDGIALAIPPNKQLSGHLSEAATVLDWIAFSTSAIGVGQEVFGTIEGAVVGSAAGGVGALPGAAMGFGEGVIAYQILNPFENAVSSVSTLTTIASDFAAGNNFVHITDSKVSIGVGHSSVLNTLGMLLGNTPLLGSEATLDTIWNGVILASDYGALGSFLQARIDMNVSPLSISVTHTGVNP